MEEGITMAEEIWNRSLETRSKGLESHALLLLFFTYIALGAQIVTEC